MTEIKAVRKEKTISVSFVLNYLLLDSKREREQDYHSKQVLMAVDTSRDKVVADCKHRIVVRSSDASLLSMEEPCHDFSLEVMVLELLLSQNLLALLPTSDQIGHDLFCRTEGLVLVCVETLPSNAVSQVV